MRRPSVVLATATATAIAFSFVLACGSDDGEAEAPSDAGAETLSKAEMIEQGDAICTRLIDETERIEQPEDETDFAAYIADVVEAAEAARSDLASLDAPKDGVLVQQELLAAFDSSIATAEGAVAAAEQGDTVSAGDLLAQAAEEGDAANAAARAYGFEVCGNDAG